MPIPSTDNINTCISWEEVDHIAREARKEYNALKAYAEKCHAVAEDFMIAQYMYDNGKLPNSKELKNLLDALEKTIEEYNLI
jgi:hemerythrin-like domain-containing protein